MAKYAFMKHMVFFTTANSTATWTCFSADGYFDFCFELLFLQLSKIRYLEERIDGEEGSIFQNCQKFIYIRYF